MSTEKSPVDSLIDDLNQRTTSQEPITEAVVDEAPESAQQGAFEQPPAPPVDLPESDIPSWSMSKAKATATRWVKMFSSFMVMMLKPAYRSTILVKGDVQKMADFTQTHKGKSEQEMEAELKQSPEMQQVANRFDKYMKAVQDSPLAEDEIEMLADPLAECILKYKHLQLGPEWSLVLAALVIITPRLTPMMPDLSQILSKAQQKASE